MSFVMHRSFAECLGVTWPPDVAYRTDIGGRRGLGSGEPRNVTWSDVVEARRKEQARRLDRKRRGDEPAVVPCYVWSFLNTGWIYGGWHCFVVTNAHRVDSDGRPVPESRAVAGELAECLVAAVPLGILPGVGAFRLWMRALAEFHPRQCTRDPRRAGAIVGWLEGRRRFSLERPEGMDNPGGQDE